MGLDIRASRDKRDKSAAGASSGRAAENVIIRQPWRSVTAALQFDFVPQEFIPRKNNADPRMRPIGRLMQMAGLALPPLSIVMQLSEAITLAQMLAMLLASAAIFWIGRIVEGYAR